MEKTTSVKSSSTKETFDDPARTKETVNDDGGQATIGGPVTVDKLVSKPGAKNAVWQRKEDI